MIKSSRIEYLDNLRFVSIFSVIILHVFATDYDVLDINSYDWYVLCIGDSLVKWCVPVLVMISGALFLQPEKNIEIRDIFHKYIPRLFRAYLFWWVVYGVINVLYKCIIQSLSFDIAFFAPWGHLWFLPMLMGLYLILPFLKQIVLNHIFLLYFLVLWAVFLTISYIPYLSCIVDTMKLNFVVGYSGYFVLGYYLSKRRFPKNQACFIYIFGCLGGAICVLGNIYMSHLRGCADTFFLSYLSPHVVLMSVGIFVLFSRINIFGKITVYRNKLTPYLFGVYLTHYLWLFIINIPVIRYGLNVAFTLPIIVLLTFILSLLTVKMLYLTPLKKIVE